jgi:hypothetical protein
MNTKQAVMGSLPQMPRKKGATKRKHNRGAQAREINSDYYTAINAAAIIPSIEAGRNQIKIYLTAQKQSQLKVIQQNIGEDFSVNNLIHKAYKLVQDGVCLVEVRTQLAKSTRGNYKGMVINPDERTLKEILSIGTRGAATQLVEIGIEHYSAQN